MSTTPSMWRHMLVAKVEDQNDSKIQAFEPEGDVARARYESIKNRLNSLVHWLASQRGTSPTYLLWPHDPDEWWYLKVAAPRVDRKGRPVSDYLMMLLDRANLEALQWRPWQLDGRLWAGAADLAAVTDRDPGPQASAVRDRLVAPPPGQPPGRRSPVDLEKAMRYLETGWTIVLPIEGPNFEASGAILELALGRPAGADPPGVNMPPLAVGLGLPVSEPDVSRWHEQMPLLPTSDPNRPVDFRVVDIQFSRGERSPNLRLPDRWIDLARARIEPPRSFHSPIPRVEPPRSFHGPISQDHSGVATGVTITPVPSELAPRPTALLDRVSPGDVKRPYGFVAFPVNPLRLATVAALVLLLVGNVVQAMGRPRKKAEDRWEIVRTTLGVVDADDLLARWATLKEKVEPTAVKLTLKELIAATERDAERIDDFEKKLKPLANWERLGRESFETNDPDEARAGWDRLIKAAGSAAERVSMASLEETIRRMRAEINGEMNRRIRQEIADWQRLSDTAFGVKTVEAARETWDKLVESLALKGDARKYRGVTAAIDLLQRDRDERKRWHQLAEEVFGVEDDGAARKNLNDLVDSLVPQGGKRGYSAVTAEIASLKQDRAERQQWRELADDAFGVKNVNAARDTWDKLVESLPPVGNARGYPRAAAAIAILTRDRDGWRRLAFEVFGVREVEAARDAWARVALAFELPLADRSVGSIEAARRRLAKQVEDLKQRVDDIRAIPPPANLEFRYFRLTPALKYEKVPAMIPPRPDERRACFLLIPDPAGGKAGEGDGLLQMSGLPTRQEKDYLDAYNKQLEQFRRLVESAKR